MQLESGDLDAKGEPSPKKSEQARRRAARCWERPRVHLIRRRDHRGHLPVHCAGGPAVRVRKRRWWLPAPKTPSVNTALSHTHTHTHQPQQQHQQQLT